ncbi:hypothetical protein [Pseudonocardia sp. 73-21]|jgi:hypothetical protein|uniref:hypothetical protein n=1 Tax=Pseudonocardia sp. 73-21 TaxID=1895809 RepID=UPI000962466E|nr:hypothetical protein [Pseudonocardia sp. 73-21]OJY51972.1 MAG: hypothetical protein BGP03_07940 [Pseudonocardia sp. 73-21]
MLDRWLLIKRLLWRAERLFGDMEVVTRVGDGYEFVLAFLAAGSDAVCRPDTGDVRREVRQEAPPSTR